MVAKKQVTLKKKGKSKSNRKGQKGRGYITIQQIETALRQTAGFKTYAAKKLNCTYENIQKRIKTSPYLQEVFESIHEGKLDLSEHKLMQQIKDDNITAILFHLKCQGKARGYVEKVQDQVSDQSEAQPVKVIIQVEDGSKREKS